MTKEDQYYILDQDDSCHWYVIPADKQKEWDEWRSLDEEDEEAWKVPDYAIRIGGGYTLVKFKNFIIE